MSVAGEFGASALRCVETLLKNEWVHYIATDTHRAKRRPPVLSEARDPAAEVVREEVASRLVRDKPMAGD